MMPIVNSVVPPPPIQTPMVNTAVPGSTVVRVPHDNVPPSVSNAQVENNTRGNNGQQQIAEEQAAPPAPIAEGEEFFIEHSYPNNPRTVTAQTTFLAQLAAQMDDSPQAQVLLVQYEKLVAFSNVKYKPSNAMKPQAEPAGAFGKILQADKAPPVPVAQSPAPALAEMAIEQAASSPTAAAIAEIRAAAKAPPREQRQAENEEPANPVVPAGITAYAASISRVYMQRAEMISDVA